MKYKLTPLSLILGISLLGACSSTEPVGPEEAQQNVNEILPSLTQSTAQSLAFMNESNPFKALENMMDSLSGAPQDDEEWENKEEEGLGLNLSSKEGEELAQLLNEMVCQRS